MATYSWAGGSGVFNVASNWLVGGVPAVTSPGTADDVVIAAAGKYTVTLSSAAFASLTVADPGALLVASSVVEVSGNITNSGTVRLTTGAFFNAATASGTLANAGTLQIGSGAAFTLWGIATTAGLGTIQNNGSATLAGILDNTGAVFVPQNFGALTVRGTVFGGTIAADTGTVMLGSSAVPNGTTLDHVTLRGTVESDNTLKVLNGLTLQGAGGTGPGFLDTGFELAVHGDTTLDNGTIFLGNGFGFPSSGISSDSTLTFAPNLIVDGSDYITNGFINGAGAFTNLGTVNVHSTLRITSASFTNNGVMATGTNFAFFGMLSRPAAGLTEFNTADGQLANNGTVLAAGGNVVFHGSVTGAGSIAISANGTINGSVEMAGFYDQQLFAFLDGSASTLKLDAPSGINALLGFRPGNRIMLPGIDASVVFNNTTLTIMSGGNAIAGFVLPDVAPGSQFQATLDSGFNTVITELPCFAAGTRLRTAAGEMDVAALRPGDRLRTASGALVPVRWIGQTRVNCRRHARPWDVRPVRIAADAFGMGQPARDVWLSPDHAVAFGGVLIPIRYLLNGRTVTQPAAGWVSYFHVELPRHDIVLAEGLACESYLDTGNRAAFAQGFGTAARSPARPCATLVMAGPMLIAARRHLLARAVALGHGIADAPGLYVEAGGRRVAARVDGRHWSVRLAPGSGPVRLRSRRWVPAYMRPAESDTRALGVAISALRFDGRAVALDDARLSSGWHAAEAAWRWTDGDAGMVLGGVGEVSFDVALVGSYWRGGRGRVEKALAFLPLLGAPTCPPAIASASTSAEPSPISSCWTPSGPTSGCINA